jgi:hypothetical protein
MGFVSYETKYSIFVTQKTKLCHRRKIVVSMSSISMFAPKNIVSYPRIRIFQFLGRQWFYILEYKIYTFCDNPFYSFFFVFVLCICFCIMFVIVLLVLVDIGMCWDGRTSSWIEVVNCLLCCLNSNVSWFNCYVVYCNVDPELRTWF